MEDLITGFKSLNIEKDKTKKVKDSFVNAVVQGKLKEALQWGLILGLNVDKENIFWNTLTQICVEYVSLEAIDCVIIIQNIKNGEYKRSKKLNICLAITLVTYANKTKLLKIVFDSLDKGKEKGKVDMDMYDLYKTLTTCLENKNFKESMKIANIIFEHGINNQLLDKNKFREVSNSLRAKKYVDFLVWDAISCVSARYHISNMCNDIISLGQANLRNKNTKYYWAHCIGIICFRDIIDHLKCAYKIECPTECWYVKRIVEAIYGEYKFDFPKIDLTTVYPEGNVIKNILNKDKMEISE